MAVGLSVLVFGGCGDDDGARASTSPSAAATTATSAATPAPTPAAADGPDVVYRDYRAAVSAGDRAKALSLLADKAVFAIGYEEGGKRVLILGGPIDPATFLANLQPGASSPPIASSKVSGQSVTMQYEIVPAPAPRSGAIRDRGTYVVTVKDGKITSYLDYVDISDPESLKYLTFIAGGKDPHTLSEFPAPADAGR